MTGEQTHKRWISFVAMVIGIAGITVVLAIVTLHLAGGSSDNGSVAKDVQAEAPADRALPEYVMAMGDQVALAYQFALDRPDVMLWMPCYCGCGGHSGHKNARDCFVQPESSPGNIQFEEHGSDCNVCVDIALMARKMTIAGSSLSATRTAVDAEFGDVGPGTDTPLPPE